MVKLLNLWFKWLGCVDSGWPGLILNFPINQFLVDGWLLPYINPPYSITINIKPTWISTHRLMTHAIWRWWECARKCFVGRAHFDSDSGFAWQKRQEIWCTMTVQFNIWTSFNFKEFSWHVCCKGGWHIVVCMFWHEHWWRYSTIELFPSIPSGAHNHSAHLSSHWLKVFLEGWNEAIPCATHPSIAIICKSEGSIMPIVNLEIDHLPCLNIMWINPILNSQIVHENSTTSTRKNPFITLGI